MLIASSALAQNLFVTCRDGRIYEFTPSGTRSTFASGLSTPEGLAFDSSGNMYEADSASGNIYEFTPSGTRSIFASGLSRPAGLAFDSAGNLYEADNGSGNIYEFSPDGTRSTFGSAFLGPVGLAFDSAGNLFAGYSGNHCTGSRDHGAGPAILDRRGGGKYRIIGFGLAEIGAGTGTGDFKSNAGFARRSCRLAAQ